MITVKIRNEDVSTLCVVLNTYPFMDDDDKDALKFNKKLERLLDRTFTQIRKERNKQNE